jgi:PhnB protein
LNFSYKEIVLFSKVITRIIFYMKTQSIPEGSNTLTPYITVQGAKKAIEFYKEAFGATEVGRITMSDGTIGHCELKINGSTLMLAEENKQWGNISPQTLGGTTVYLSLYVKDVDTVFDKAIKAGAKVLGDMVPKDQFHGDRSGSLTDPFGHRWTIMTRIEDVSFPEMQKRADALFK